MGVQRRADVELDAATCPKLLMSRPVPDVAIGLIA